MDSIYTLMIFVPNQPQAVVMQYKTPAKALRDRNALVDKTGEKVVIADDYGRELAFSPSGSEIVLFQDVDLAAEGNTIGNVKNNIANTLAQIRSQEEAEKDPAVKAAITRQKLQQGLNGGGAFRQ